MKILVTGAYGFIGKNLCFHLKESGFTDLIKIGSESSIEDLREGLNAADFIFHLAGVNRPEIDEDFTRINLDMTSDLVNELLAAGKQTPILLSSSIKSLDDSKYGRSKAGAEKILSTYHIKSNADVFIYRLPNVFGKWCKPNYNSVVATFCYNITRGLPISINDPATKLDLVHIDTVCDVFLRHLQPNAESSESLFQDIQQVYSVTLNEIVRLLESFRDNQSSLVIEDVGSGFIRDLYSTFISYYSSREFSYEIPNYEDSRGDFSELLKTKHAGQFSYFTAFPGVTRGGHYHHTKNEKFFVIRGLARFRFKHIVTGELFELEVQGGDNKVVETIPGWTHDITNVGETELIVMLWANEIFNKDKPDTFAEKLNF